MCSFQNTDDIRVVAIIAVARDQKVMASKYTMNVSDTVAKVRTCVARDRMRSNGA